MVKPYYETPSVDELFENLKKNGGRRKLSSVVSVKDLKIGDRFKVLNKSQEFIKVDMRKLYDKKTVYGAYGMNVDTQEVVYFDSYTQVKRVN